MAIKTRQPRRRVILRAHSSPRRADAMNEDDPERDAHLLEIGRAITEWAAVQDELYSIVLTILRCAPRHASRSLRDNAYPLRRCDPTPPK
jgi:hypothetical protein